jgi:hypothetical protein
MHSACLVCIAAWRLPLRKEKKDKPSVSPRIQLAISFAYRSASTILRCYFTSIGMVRQSRIYIYIYIYIRLLVASTPTRCHCVCRAFSSYKSYAHCLTINFHCCSHDIPPDIISATHCTKIATMASRPFSNSTVNSLSCRPLSRTAKYPTL